MLYVLIERNLRKNFFITRAMPGIYLAYSRPVNVYTLYM